MAERFTIELTEETAKKIREIAKLAKQPPEIVIAETLSLDFHIDSVQDASEFANYSTVHLWILAHSQLEFPPEQDKRMLELLKKSKSGNFSKIEFIELENLYHRYEYYNELRGNVLHELKRRGEDLSPLTGKYPYLNFL